MAKLKIYCSTCGKPAEYDLNKPKFCFSCGYSYADRLKATEEIKVQEEEIEEKKVLFNINKLEVDTVFYDVQKESVKDLSKYPGSPTKRVKASAPKISSKQALEDFRKEAGSLRKKNGP